MNDLHTIELLQPEEMFRISGSKPGQRNGAVLGNLGLVVAGMQHKVGNHRGADQACAHLFRVGELRNPERNVA